MERRSAPAHARIGSTKISDGLCGFLSERQRLHADRRLNAERGKWLACFKRQRMVQQEGTFEVLD
jgi:hypothetical protein